MIEHGISRDDMIRREAISGIMCDLELDKAKFGRQWDIDFDVFFADALNDFKELAADGLIALEPGIIRVTETGRIFLRNIAMPFDAYLRQQTTEIKPRYSKTL